MNDLTEEQLKKDAQKRVDLFSFEKEIEKLKKVKK